MRIGEHREELAARFLWLVRAGYVGLALVASTYFSVQVVSGARYREMAENNRLRRLAIDAPRGTITDRHGRVLVENLPSYSLELDRSATKDLGASLRFASEVLGRPVAELEALIARYKGRGLYQPVLVAESLSIAAVARFRVARLEHPEFEVEVGQRRFYRLGAHGAHLFGYLGEVRAEELERPGSPYRSGDWVGRRGVELAFDTSLRGDDGERVVVVDSRGLPIEEFGRRLGRPGRPLRLTIDAALQQEAEHALEGQVGAIVAIDPRDGAVRALVSAPGYDPNLFTRRLDVASWRALVDDPHHPLQNRALSSAYSPGSVFKLVMGTAGLVEGEISTSTTAFCGGGANFYGRRFHCWKKGGHGTVDLERALAGSCDVYFYTLGQRLGIDRIARYSRAFGLGTKTGIALDGERSGLVPDDAWSRRVRKHPWYGGETISVAIGQGALSTTPIQIAVATAALANGGRLVTPHLVEGEAQPPRPMAIPPEAFGPVARGLFRVVNEPGGTGGSARLPHVHVAGKTGTTQVVSQVAYSDSTELPWEQRNHAWFASYAPFERPELVVVVFVEHGGQGSKAAAPLAKLVLSRYFGSDAAAVAAAL